MKTITTQKVNCKDCHRCVRSCPVKAIGIEKGQAHVVDEKCILCGKCVVECPQNAKQVENQLPLVKQQIDQGRPVILTLAPSFVGIFPEYTPDQLANIICQLGVIAVEETAIGAEVVSQYYKQLLYTANKPIISTCCPVIVNLVEKYFPQLIDNFAAALSPMMVHGQILKQKYGANAFVVFAGPCIAKIAERDIPQSPIDAALTFAQLKEWMGAVTPVPGGALMASEAYGRARYYPLAGGVLKSFLDHEQTDIDVIAVDGIEKCIEVFEALIKGEIAPRFIEAMACAGGCISGPASGSSSCLPAKRVKVVAHALNSTACQPHCIPDSITLTRTHTAKPITSRVPTEAEIQDILRQTGKFTKADEKNCGACGYNSCREKAIAVFQGLAQIDMCVPYMKSKAESFANIIVDNSLNAIIVVNNKMVIQEFNRAAETMFLLDKECVKGRNLAEFIDCTHFMKAAMTGSKVVGKRVEYPQYNLITEQMLIPVSEQGLVIGILTDVTADEKREQALQHMKLETVEKVTEIINKQMHVAQQIAGLLGETTAETKSALLEVMWLLKDKGES